jgi:hypothetical protein
MQLPGSEEQQMAQNHPPSRFRSILAGIGVHAGIYLAVALFLGAITLLYYRSITLVEPSSVVDVQGNESLKGAVAQISGPGLDGPLRAPFDETHGYNGRFFLDRGSYLLTVKRNGQTLYHLYFFLADRTRATLPIPLAPTTQPGH